MLSSHANNIMVVCSTIAAETTSLQEELDAVFHKELLHELIDRPGDKIQQKCS